MESGLDLKEKLRDHMGDTIQVETSSNSLYLFFQSSFQLSKTRLNEAETQLQDLFNPSLSKILDEANTIFFDMPSPVNKDNTVIAAIFINHEEISLAEQWILAATVFNLLVNQKIIEEAVAHDAMEKLREILADLALSSHDEMEPLYHASKSPWRLAKPTESEPILTSSKEQWIDHQDDQAEESTLTTSNKDDVPEKNFPSKNVTDEGGTSPLFANSFIGSTKRKKELDESDSPEATKDEKSNENTPLTSQSTFPPVAKRKKEVSEKSEEETMSKEKQQQPPF